MSTTPQSRMSVRTQVEDGRLVCPRTRQRLTFDDGRLVTPDGTSYGLHGDVPILLEDVERAREYVATSGQMVSEYEGAAEEAAPRSLKDRVYYKLMREGRDYRTDRSIRALRDVVEGVGPGALSLSIGGGPLREHPSLVNVNIGPFVNVDVVADAHRLPYADGSVDAIYCEAVLEHLADPRRAVAEMSRVCRPGALVYANTPFMQAYHGYPNHFQNLTLSGHEHVFASNGFRIRESGTAVGPLFALLELAGRFIEEFPGDRMRRALRWAWILSRYVLLPRDRHFNVRPNAYVLASTTYLVAEKI